MKIYLDDERQVPDGWIGARWPQEVIALLERGGVTEISLDHDLGDDVRGTGYDVIKWIEMAVATRGFVPPRILIHTANLSARDKMRLGVDSIERLAKQNVNETDGRARAPDEESDSTSERWRSWDELVPKDSLRCDEDDLVASEAAMALTKGLPPPIVTISVATDGSRRTYFHSWPPRKIHISIPPADVRGLLAKALATLAPNPEIASPEARWDEYSLDEIMACATESERSAIQAALNNKAVDSIEKAILAILKRALPSCPKCDKFAFRTHNGTLRCGRCGPIEPESESR